MSQSSHSSWKYKLLIHGSIIFFSILAVLLTVSMNKNMDLFSVATCIIFFSLASEIEAFFWLGRYMFRSVKGETPGELTRWIVFRFILFYLTCLSIAALVFVFSFALNLVARGESLNSFFMQISQSELKGWFAGTNIGLTIGAFVFFILQWQQALYSVFRLKEEKLAFQYETIKNQVNPHFLFNSLNTLSSFIKSQPDIAERYVRKLSSIYRYITDHGSDNMISLEEEIEFVMNYFYLHKLRDEEKIQIRIEEGNYKSFRIVPVSLQILVENALKHNIASRDKPLLIKIFMEKGFIVVQNNLQKMNKFGDSPGKGLNNLQQRIRLLLHKEIEIVEDRDLYTVKVPIIS